MTLSTASTARGAKRFEYWDTTLELSDVFAFLIRVSLSSKETGLAIDLKISKALADAF